MSESNFDGVSEGTKILTQVSDLLKNFPVTEETSAEWKHVVTLLKTSQELVRNAALGAASRDIASVLKDIVANSGIEIKSFSGSSPKEVIEKMQKHLKENEKSDGAPPAGT